VADSPPALPPVFSLDVVLGNIELPGSSFRLFLGLDRLLVEVFVAIFILGPSLETLFLPALSIGGEYSLVEYLGFGY